MRPAENGADPVPRPCARPPASPDVAPSDYTGQGDAFNCADFASQADAQVVLRADPTDPNELDADDDGIACERSRGPRGMERVPRS